MNNILGCCITTSLREINLSAPISQNKLFLGCITVLRRCSLLLQME